MIKSWKLSFWNWEEDSSTLSLLFNIELVLPTSTDGRKKINGLRIREADIQDLLLADDMTIYIKNQKDLIKLLKWIMRLISLFRKSSRCEKIIRYHTPTKIFRK